LQEKIQKISPVKQRILHFVDTLGISKRDFYSKVGVSRGTLESPSGITEETLAKVIASYPRLSPSWLINGIGEMQYDERGTVMTIDLNTEKKGIPYYDLPASAGDLTVQLVDAKPISYIDLPQLSGCTAILPVYGSSMKGIVEPGDLIAIKEIQTRDQFDPAMPHLVITDEYRMIKYLRADPDDSSVIWAESTNHQKIRLAAESIKMVYAIKGIVRIY